MNTQLAAPDILRDERIGKKFGRLTVLATDRRDKWGHHMWLCRCDCGKKTITPKKDILSGHTKSCGCLKNELTRERNTIHGMSDTSEFNVWKLIKRRCCCRKSASWKYYGGRGIKMSESWKSSFVAFFNDMGPRPSLSHSIDRIDNDSGYSKENCRWATVMEQARNKKNTRRIAAFGETKCRAAWGSDPRCVVHENTFIWRIKRGWSPEDAMTRPQMRSGGRPFKER